MAKKQKRSERLLVVDERIANSLQAGQIAILGGFEHEGKKYIRCRVPAGQITVPPPDSSIEPTPAPKAEDSIVHAMCLETGDVITLKPTYLVIPVTFKLLIRDHR